MSSDAQRPNLRLAVSTPQAAQRLTVIEDRVSIIQTFRVERASLSDAMRALARGAWVKIQDGVVYTTDPSAFDTSSD